MSWKDEFIKRNGEEAYWKRLEQGRAWHKSHPLRNAAAQRERINKGGKQYEKYLEYQRTGLSGERCRIRAKHRHMYRKYKKIIAPDSQLHHQWDLNASTYRGVALVEADQHMHGNIDVIQILEGEITLFSEKEIGGQEVV